MGKPRESFLSALLRRLILTQHCVVHIFFFFKLLGSPPNLACLRMAKRPLNMQNLSLLGRTVPEIRPFKVQEAPHNVTFLKTARIATISGTPSNGQETTHPAEFQPPRTNGFRDTAFQSPRGITQCHHPANSTKRDPTA